MFTITQDEKLLAFTEIKDSTSFGDSDRVLFWIDMEIGMLQRGRQEMIPFASIDRFRLKGSSLIADLGHHEMTLYTASANELKQLEAAVPTLNSAISS